ncbi:MAG: hypothetical protein R3F24_04340 [Gammaproteobacteria bacterium]
MEYLRVAVDYDGIPPDDLWRFNLTIQRDPVAVQLLVESRRSGEQ